MKKKGLGMRYIKRITLAGLLLGLFTGAFAQTTWTTRTPVGAPEFHSVVWTGTQLVAVADSGLIRTSPDGVTWTARTSGTTADFFSVAWTGSLLVAVGEQGTVRTSPDGITWTARSTLVGDPLFSVVWTGTQVVIAGGFTANGTILTSPTGTTWTQQTVGACPSLYGIAWTGTQLVAVGDSGAVRTSTNGTTWTARPLGTGTSPTLYAVAWSGSQVVAVGYNPVGSTGAVLTSPDGVTWTNRTSGTGSGLNGVVAGASQLVVVGDGGAIRTSPDGITWTARTSGVGSILLGIAYTGTQFVAVGRSATILTSPETATTPAAPVLTAPAQNATGVAVSPTLTWNASAGAATYRVQLSTDSTFATTLVNDSTVATTTRAVGPLATNTVYFWRVNAKNTAGTSTYSTVFRFTTAGTVTVPSAPVLTLPAQNATGVALSPTLTWNASAGAATYRVQLSTDSNFVTTLVNDSTVTATTRAVGPLANNTIYYWRVNAKNTAGTSAYSTRFRFTTTATVTVPSAPVLVAPAQNATGVAPSPILSWNASAGAATYRLQVATDSTFTTLVLNDSTVTSTSFVATLGNNTLYFWRVNAKNTAGTSAYSTVFRFTTGTATTPAAPVLTAPAQAATGIALSPVLSWAASAGATTYRVQVSLNAAFTTTVVNDSTVTGTTRTVGPLTNNTTYYWRVNAKNSAGTSAYSSTWSFTTVVAAPSAPVLGTPALNATGVAQNPTLSWTASAGATTYRLQVSTDSNFATTFLNDSTITGTSRALTGLAANTVYYWRVNAKNAGGTSAYSTRFRFTTTGPNAILAHGIVLEKLRVGNGQSLRFGLPARTHVQIRLYNSQGQLVSLLLDETREAGYQSVSLPAGLQGPYYLLDFRAGNSREVMKLHP